MTSTAPSVSPSLIPSLSISPSTLPNPTLAYAPTPSPTPDPDDEFFFILLICVAVLIGGIFGAWLLSKFVDRFLSTEIDAAILRRIEQMINERNQNHRKNTILDGLTDEERLRILERVLDVKPYSRELGAQLKIEREKAEENDKIQKAIVESSISEQPNKNSEDDDDVGSNGDSEGGQEQAKQEDVNILQRVWEEFGASKNIKKGKRESNEDRIQRIENNTSQAGGEVTETCAICMEDYGEHQDVIIGHSCDHMYHKECLLKWMCMEARHNSCPYCRNILFSEQTFRKSAEEMVGTERYQELVQDEADIEEGGAPSATDSDVMAENESQGQEELSLERSDQER